MSGVAIMRQLLLERPQVTDLVPVNRIVSGVVRQGETLPAIGISEISSNEFLTTARNLGTKMIRERVQVTVLVKVAPGDESAYGLLKRIIKAAALGPGMHTGVVKGFRVCSILPGGVGPEIPPADDGIYEQSRDFMVTFIEAN